jgi:hypothetical protein
MTYALRATRRFQENGLQARATVLRGSTAKKSA